MAAAVTGCDAAGPGTGASPPLSPATATRVVMLGTGTLNADPEHSGPALAVVVGDRAYLVDAGPGVVRRAALAAREHGIEALTAPRLNIVFLTHLHSDHTVGLPDLIHTPWVLEREVPLAVFGPLGTAAMAEHLTAAWELDIRNRLSGPQPTTPDGWRVQATDIDSAGVIYQDDRVRVTAIAVPHTGWASAYGYRFDTADRSIVISGDTEPSTALADACGGCDVLVHEVYSADAFEALPPEWQRYHATSHTSTDQLARLATRADPGLLVLYHHLLWSKTPAHVLEEMHAGYEGPVAFARDLDVF